MRTPVMAVNELRADREVFEWTLWIGFIDATGDNLSMLRESHVKILLSLGLL